MKQKTQANTDEIKVVCDNCGVVFWPDDFKCVMVMGDDGDMDFVPGCPHCGSVWDD